MLTPNCTFDIELDKLLKDYLGDNNYSDFNVNLIHPESGVNGIDEKINNFYRDQLKIKADNFNERIKIDRTITFSEKKLENNKFCRFLLELGKVCISGGKLNLAAEIFKKAKIKSSSLTIYKAESLIGLANVYINRGSWSRSLSAIAEAQSIFTQINDNHGMAKCENLLGSISGELGDIENAKKHFETSLNLMNPQKNSEIAANVEANLGIINSIQGNLDDALFRLNNALKIFKELSDFKNIANVTLNLGMVYFEKENYSSAISAFDEGIEIAKKYRFLSTLCMFYLAKSRALIPLKAFHYAAEFAEKALEISHSTDNKVTIADIYKVKGTIERELKNFNISENYLLNSLRINTTLKNELNIAETCIELGMLYDDLKNFESKSFYLKSALDYYKKIKDSMKVKKIEETLSFNMGM